MPRLSTLSNPTGLIDLEKNRISILIDESSNRIAFSLARLDVADLTLPIGLNVVVIARRGNAEERIELGPIASWNKGFVQLSELGDEGAWSFRVLLVRPSSAMLVAAAENIRPDGQGDSSSFIALAPSDLGQRPWKVEVLEMEGRAVLYFNKAIFHSVGEAEADRFFIGMVLPEAARQLVSWVSRHLSVLADPSWEPFRRWLELHGITDEPEEGNAEMQDEWCARVVDAFCERFRFVEMVGEARSKGLEV